MPLNAFQTLSPLPYPNSLYTKFLIIYILLSFANIFGRTLTTISNINGVSIMFINLSL